MNRSHPQDGPAPDRGPHPLLSWAGAWLQVTWQDLRHGARGLARNRGFTLVAVLSLAAGIGLNSVVFSVINSIFLRPAHGIADAERVVFGPRVSYPAVREIREGSRTLASLAVAQPRGVNLEVGGLAFRATARLVSENYFAVLGVRPAAGRFFVPGGGPLPEAIPEAVLDHWFWRERLGGDPSVVGATITVDGVPLTIVGVTPADLYGPGPERPPLWVPLGMRPALERRAVDWSDPKDAGLGLVGRLRDGAGVRAAEAEVAALLAARPGLAPERGISFAPGGRESWDGTQSPEKYVEWLLVVVVPLVVAGVILWIGCSNVANLLLARGVVRRRETAVRLAVGASRSRIVRQMLTEALLLAGLGGALGLLAGSWLIDLVWIAFPEFPQMYVTVDGRVVGYTAFVSVVATLVFGLVPALQATRVSVTPALKGEGPASARGARLRTFFLVTQIASSMALLVVAGTFVSNLVRSYAGESSAEVARLVIGRVQLAGEGEHAGYWARVREEVGALPGVASVSLTPDPAGASTPLRVVGADGATDSLRMAVQEVDAEYFATVGATVLGGRGLAPLAPGARAAEVVVNELGLRALGAGRDALGAEVVLGDSLRARVVGVVRDGGREARAYRAADGRAATGTIFVRTLGPSEGMVAPVRGALSRLTDQRARIDVSTLRQAQFGTLQRITGLSLAIGAVALTLAAVGLYGSIAFFTTQRTREIAIRLALGASRRQIFGLVLGHGLRVMAAGAAIGLVAVAVALRVLGGAVFGAWGLDVATLAGVALVFALTTAAASFFPGRRALRLDPMAELRAE